MKQLGYPNAKVTKIGLVFSDGHFCKLPKEYTSGSSKIELEQFYNELLSQKTTENLIIDVDPYGYTYLKIGFLCYVGIITNRCKHKLYRRLKHRFPDNHFSIEYIQKKIVFEYDLLNYREYLPIEIITQNIHELRGLNSKISGNIDNIMSIDSEAEWEEKFEEQSDTVKKIYVGSRLIKFILDNFKFYRPNFFEDLTLNKDSSFIAHRSVSKIVKIYRNDFKKDRAEIIFEGTSFGRVIGDKEYFEILIKIMIENALKYSEFPKKIGPKVYISEDSNLITIEVHSYGRAIPESDQQYLFVKGFRSKVNKESKEGTGMGLHNAKQLAKHFKGNIEFSYKDVSNVKSIDLAWNIFTLKLNKANG